MTGNDSRERFWTRYGRSWTAFWFTPRDPTVLGFVRICCGAITCYTLFLYSFSLQDFLGPEGWIDQEHSDEILHDRPIQIGTLSGWPDHQPRPARTPEEERYARDYFDKFRQHPYPPFPKNLPEAMYCELYHKQFGFDLRTLGLPPPQNDKQWSDLLAYTEKWKLPMPPPYPASEAEVAEIRRYTEQFKVDPRRVYARGAPLFSVFYHVDHPVGMALAHGLFVLASLLFTLGVASRITSVVTLFAALNYIHRNNAVLFGADTMMVILLAYLAIGPSGAALSLDRWFVRWWNGRRSGGGIARAEAPQASVSANIAIRLLQVHLCIIYGMAGLSKLQGNAWWDGTALWNVLANFEMAPMQFRPFGIEVYTEFLRLLGRHELLFQGFLTFGAYFTLFFEITYMFWIWRPSTRWLMLSAAILLHGFIGVLMGLSTFALIMLVMNMAFLRTEEVYWILGLFGINPPVAQPVTALA